MPNKFHKAIIGIFFSFFEKGELYLFSSYKNYCVNLVKTQIPSGKFCAAKYPCVCLRFVWRQSEFAFFGAYGFGCTHFFIFKEMDMDVLDVIFFICFLISGSAAIKRGKKFMIARDEFMKSAQTEYPKELKDLQKKFISDVVSTIISLLAVVF